jgi:hypothetical protein
VVREIFDFEFEGKVVDGLEMLTSEGLEDTS